MAGIGAIFDVGARAMAASKLAMNTTNHNIANSNTDGYSKQRIQLTTAEPYSIGPARIGNGVKVSGSTRAHAGFLQMQIIDESSHTGKYALQSQGLAELEGVLNEALTEKMNKAFSEFFNNFRDLAVNPESEAVRRTVIEGGRSLVRSVRSTQQQLQELQNTLDFRIKHRISQVNGLARKIAGLNSSIANIQASGLNPNDEMDKRDLAVRQLSQIVEIKTSKDQQNRVNVVMGNRLPIVTGNVVIELDALPSEADDPKEGGKPEGAFEIFALSSKGRPRKARTAISGGEVLGLMNVRDGTLTEVRDRLDKMIHGFVDAVNTVHRKGYGRDGISGRNFFKPMGKSIAAAPKDGKAPRASNAHAGAMAKFELAQTSNDSDFLGAGARPNAPGDNRIAVAISRLEQTPILENGQATIAEHFAATVGELGVVVANIDSFKEHHGGILRQLNAYRESLTGVSMDEEAANLVKLQHQFNASAKMIRTGDEMLQTVLSLKR